MCLHNTIQERAPKADPGILICTDKKTEAPRSEGYKC